MKIVHIFWGLGYGGIETMLVNIANAQADLDEDIHVVIINELFSKELLNSFKEKVTVHLLHRKLKSKGVGFVFRMNHILMQIRPDVIHLHASKLYTLLWRKSLRRISLVTLHSLPIGLIRSKGIAFRLLPFLNKSGNVESIDKVPRVVSISQAVRDELWNNYGVKSVVVNNGILTNNFAKRMKVSADIPLRVVQVSRLMHEKKGQDLLIEAAAKLNGAILVDFIGDGDSRDYLEELTKRLHAESFVTFLGTRPQSYIANHVCEYDLFVQPSRYEGFGLTVAEAMASQVPVLVSEGQGPAEVTCGNQYGWVFKNGSSEDLASKIRYIIEHYDEAEQKAVDAMKYIQDTYDVSVTAQRYIEVYKELIGRQ